MFFGVQDESKNSGLSTSEMAEGASDIGSLLCATRMRLGKDLQDVAGVLRIRYTYLVAIEDGRYEDLPGLAYALGFVRAYADYLGLDGEQVVKRFKEESSGIAPAKVYEFPVRAAENGIPSGALLMIAMVMGVFSYGSWYGLTASDRSPTELIQKAPQHLASLLGPRAQEPVTPSAGSAIAGETLVVAAEPEPTVAEVVVADPAENTEPTEAPAPVIEAPVQVAVLEPVAEQPPAQQIEPAPAPEPVVTPEPVVEEPAENPVAADPQPFVEEVVEETTEVAPELVAAAPQIAQAPPAEDTAVEEGTSTEQVIETAEVAEISEAAEVPEFAEVSENPAASEEGQVAEQVAALSAEPVATIELKASSDSWIQVRDGDELVLTRLLRAGEVYTVPQQNGLTLMTGNAGGLNILVDGEEMPPLGDEGVVRRGVPLSAEYLRTLSQEGEG